MTILTSAGTSVYGASQSNRMAELKPAALAFGRLGFGRLGSHGRIILGRGQMEQGIPGVVVA
jgi:hypothetical protein